ALGPGQHAPPLGAGPARRGRRARLPRRSRRAAVAGDRERVRGGPPARRAPGHGPRDRAGDQRLAPAAAPGAALRVAAHDRRAVGRGLAAAVHDTATTLIAGSPDSAVDQLAPPSSDT